MDSCRSGTDVDWSTWYQSCREYEENTIDTNIEAIEMGLNRTKTIVYNVNCFETLRHDTPTNPKALVGILNWEIPSQSSSYRISIVARRDIPVTVTVAIVHCCVVFL